MKNWAAIWLAGAAMGGMVQGVAQAEPAKVLSSVQGDVAITIYNHDLALVQDLRQLALPAGRSVQEMAEVSAQIRPETVTIAAAGASVLEQNFDYDLLSPERLVDKGVGQDVTIIRTNPATGAETVEKGRILANNGGTLVQIGSRIEVLGDMKARLVFDQLPEGLKARPTLSVALDAAKSGTRPVSLSYLSRGFGWKADYVALFDEAAGKMDVQGWVTLNNTSGTSFNAAKVLLVAGDVGVSNGGDDDVDEPQPMFRRGGVASGKHAMGVEGSDREQLGDFYVYPISGRVQVANQQQKQISFLNVTGAAARKLYTFRNEWLGAQDEAQSFATSLAFSTGAKEGLGDALPAGTMRIYMRDARGQAQFIGEDSIAHTPQGSLLTVKTGEAFDVKIQPLVEKREKIDAGEWERVARFRVGEKVTTVEAAKTYWRTHMRYNLTNARAQPVEVEVVQAGLDGGAHDTRVSAESVKGEQRNANERVWHVTIPAHGSLALTAQIDTRY